MSVFFTGAEAFAAELEAEHYPFSALSFARGLLRASDGYNVHMQASERAVGPVMMSLEIMRLRYGLWDTPRIKTWDRMHLTLTFRVHLIPYRVRPFLQGPLCLAYWVAHKQKGVPKEVARRIANLVAKEMGVRYSIA